VLLNKEADKTLSQSHPRLMLRTKFHAQVDKYFLPGTRISHINIWLT